MLPSDVKMALENYHMFKRAIQDDTDKINDINAKRFKAGSSVIKIPECPKDRSTVIIENLMSLEYAQQCLSIHTYLVNLADDFINSLNEPYKGLIQDWYIERKDHEHISIDFGLSVRKKEYSIKQMHRIINALVERYVNAR